MGNEKIIKTAILIEKGTKLYKFLYLIFQKDGSIYLTYPREKGYKIISDTEIINKPKKGNLQQIQIQRKDTNLDLPKISFHPGKMSIHVNTNKFHTFKTDRKVLNKGANAIAIPFCQVLIPFNATYLDFYNPNKKYLPLNIQIPKTSNNAMLSLHFWIHDPKYNIHLEDLPMVKELKKISEVIISQKFTHRFLEKFICSVFIHDLGNREKSEGSNNIITAVFNNQNPYVFELMPKEKKL